MWPWRPFRPHAAVTSSSIITAMTWNPVLRMTFPSTAYRDRPRPPVRAIPNEPPRFNWSPDFSSYPPTDPPTGHTQARAGAGTV